MAKEQKPDGSGLADSGERMVMSTGARKEAPQEGKGAYHLVPTTPIRKVAEIYRKGAIKYTKKDATGKVIETGDRNWEKGVPLSVCVDSAKRHFDQFVEGMEDEDHLHQAIWWLFAISHNMEMIKRGLLPPTLDDLPSYGEDGVEIEVRPGFTCKRWRIPATIWMKEKQHGED
jgi:hypothetical protein